MQGRSDAQKGGEQRVFDEAKKGHAQCIATVSIFATRNRFCIAC
jgi:hypothetical protein